MKSKSKKKGVVKVNPDGPNPFVYSQKENKPTKIDNIVGDKVIEWLLDNDLRFKDIEWGTNLFEVEWSESKSIFKDYGVEIHPPENPRKEDWCNPDSGVNQREWREADKN
jgi:hypothetical protein